VTTRDAFLKNYRFGCKNRILSENGNRGSRKPISNAPGVLDRCIGKLPGRTRYLNHAQFYGPAAVNRNIVSANFGQMVRAADPQLIEEVVDGLPAREKFPEFQQEVQFYLGCAEPTTLSCSVGPFILFLHACCRQMSRELPQGAPPRFLFHRPHRTLCANNDETPTPC
jgi:hypothetical protein